MKSFELYKSKVENALREFLEKKLETDGGYAEEIKELIENILEYNLRNAKRIRPLISIFAYECFKNDERIVKASIALELMQAYLLIHDDIIDNSNLRRGKPSMHKLYESLGKDFGKSIAILAGNLCSNYACESILNSEFNETEKINALKSLVWINNRENYGQALDIYPGFQDLNEEEILKIYELKTATYTFQGPIYIGAILANASQEKINSLEKYACNLGVAFQIQDDIKGVFGNVIDTGKPNDSDIKEGKKTLLIVKALELSNSEYKKFLLENYGKKEISDSEIEIIRKIFRNCGAMNYCQKKFNELIEEARNSILHLEIRDEGKNMLLEMADYLQSL